MTDKKNITNEEFYQKILDRIQQTKANKEIDAEKRKAAFEQFVEKIRASKAK